MFSLFNFFKTENISDESESDSDSHISSDMADQEIQDLQKDIKTLITELSSMRGQVTTLVGDFASVKSEVVILRGGPPPPPPPPPPIPRTSHVSSPRAIVVVVASSLTLPVYDSKSMSPEHFLSEIEDFLIMKGTPKAQWHLLVGRMFPTGDLTQWWSSIKKQTHSWTTFRIKFLAYEKCEVNEDMQYQALFTKRQRFDEAFESFAWDIRRMAFKLQAGIDEASIVDRILNACLPELSTALTHYQCKTVEDLVRRARQVIPQINKIRKLEKKTFFRARQSDPVNSPQPNPTRVHNPNLSNQITNLQLTQPFRQFYHLLRHLLTLPTPLNPLLQLNPQNLVVIVSALVMTFRNVERELTMRRKSRKRKALLLRKNNSGACSSRVSLAP
jgi:hypothetical protein